MLMPSIFGESLFDDWRDYSFPDVEKVLYGKNRNHMMKTDIRETNTGYEMAIDLPGFKKDEININLENGYLTINAAKGLDKNEKDQNGKYIRQERYASSMTRSFYVGEGITERDIHAKYEDGTLRLELPKQEKQMIEDRHRIMIE